MFLFGKSRSNVWGIYESTPQTKILRIRILASKFDHATGVSCAEFKAFLRITWAGQVCAADGARFAYASSSPSREHRNEAIQRQSYDLYRLCALYFVDPISFSPAMPPAGQLLSTIVRILLQSNE